MSDTMGYDNIEVRTVDKHTRLDTVRQEKAIRTALLDAEGNMIDGAELTVKVPTGRIIVTETTRKDKKGKTVPVTKRHGEDEIKDRKAFVEAAKDTGYSARMEATYLPNNVTSLRVWLESQREFSDEAVALRTLALTARLDRLAREKHHKTPGPETEVKVKEHSGKLAEAIKAAQTVNTDKTKAMLADVRVRNPWAFPKPPEKKQGDAAK